MPLDTLLNRLEGFLHAEQDWVQCKADDATRGRRETERRDALDELGTALEDYEAALAAGRPIRRLLVAVDGTAPSGWAVDTAVRLASELGGKICVVHVIRDDGAFTPEFGYSGSGLLDEQRRQEADDILARAKSHVPESLLLKVEAKQGDPIQHIIAAAREWAADLIVMGTHGRGSVAHFLLGSTAEAVVRHAHCPVLTIGHEPVKAKPAGCTCASGKCCAASKAAKENRTQVAIK